MRYETVLIFPLFVVSCAIFRVLLRSWLTPPAFCALYWTFFIFLNLLHPEYEMLVTPLLYILAVLWIFAGAHFAIRTLYFNDEPHAGIREWLPGAGFRSAHFRIGLVLLVVMGLAYVAVLQRQAIVVVDNISWWLQLLLISHFSGPLIVGVLLGARLLRGADRYLAFSVLIPALVVSVLYTGRTAFFGPSVIFATGYLAGTICAAPRNTPLISVRRVVIVAGAMVVSTFYGTGIYVLRTARGEAEFNSLKEKVSVFASSFEAEALTSAFEKMRSHIYGQPSSFSFIFRDHYAQPSFQPMGGKFFLAGPLVLVGVERPAHENYLTVDGVETNVYTVFAPAIEDFGVTGSLFWWAAMGAFSAVAFRLAQRGRLVGASLVTIMLMNLQIGSCFLFRYNSVIAAYILLLGVSHYVDRRNRALGLIRGIPRFFGAPLRLAGMRRATPESNG